MGYVFEGFTAGFSQREAVRRIAVCSPSSANSFWAEGRFVLPFRRNGVMDRHAPTKRRKGNKTNMSTEETDTAATVAERGAHVAPEKAPSKKGASKTKGAPKG